MSDVAFLPFIHRSISVYFDSYFDSYFVGYLEASDLGVWAFEPARRNRLDSNALRAIADKLDELNRPTPSAEKTAENG